MYGRYSRQLGEFAKLEGLRAQEKRRLKEEKARKKELRGYQGKTVFSTPNQTKPNNNYISSLSPYRFFGLALHNLEEKKTLIF